MVKLELKYQSAEARARERLSGGTRENERRSERGRWRDEEVVREVRRSLVCDLCGCVSGSFFAGV